MSKKIIGALLLAVASQSFAYSNTPNILEPSNIHWQQLPVAPILQYAVLAGDPTKREFFVARLKLPGNYTDIVHQHSEARYDTIISGSYFIGFGNRVEKQKTHKLLAGSFITCPARVKHYGYTEEPTVIQISGIGPWEALNTAGADR